MRKLVIEDDTEGLAKFMGEKILLMCANYFYAGKLLGINDDCVLLGGGVSIVYETGEWSASAYKDAQVIGETWYVRLDAIESYGAGK